MKPVVFIRETDDRKSFTRAMMKRFEEKWSGKNVFVKPNIVSHERYPTTTHPDVLDEVLRALTKKDCEVVVGDGPAPDAGGSDNIIEHHPLQKVCGKYDIELCNLHKEPFKKVMTRTGFKMRVSEVPFSYDYLISLPVLKYHSHVKLTGALKNHFGFLKNRERILMHMKHYMQLDSIHRGIAELHNVFKANLIIMDGARTMRGAQEQRHGGKVLKLGYMFGGQDPVALDCAGLYKLREIVPELKGIEPMDIKYIKIAQEMGIGSSDYKKST
jgi:uncharacterized protein (DUF362 family)